MTAAYHHSIEPSFSLPSLDQLDRSLAYRLALVVAPAGSGKTERLHQWVTTRLHPNQIMTAWMSLRSTDNIEEIFLANLATAINVGICPPAGGNPLIPQAPIQTREKDLSTEDNLTDIINHLSGMGSPCVLIFDHYHVILSPPIHSSVQYLVDHLPEQMHLVIASRFEPPLVLGRYRVRRQLVTYGL